MTDLSQKRDKMTVLKRFESKSVTTCTERSLQNLFSLDNDIKERVRNGCFDMKRRQQKNSNNITLSKVNS